MTRGHLPLQFEMAQVFLDDNRHGHAQGSGKILVGHGTQSLGILQQTSQTVGQIPGVTCTIELDGQIFHLGHLAEIFDICADDRYTVRACKMSDTAAAGGRSVGHNQRRGTLEKRFYLIFLNVACEFDAGMVPIFLLD